MAKHVLCGFALLALTAAEASRAADMPAAYKAPPVVYAYSWSGFYIGANVGYGWGNNQQPVFTANDPFAALFLAGSLGVGQLPPVVSPAHRLQGGFGGLQVGYNWQVNPYLLVGLEADFQGSSIRGNGAAVSLVDTPTLAATITSEHRIRWFSTTRARLGFLPTPNWLIYGTGGFAYGKVGESINVGFAGTFTGVTLASGGFGSFCVDGIASPAANCFVGASSRIASGWTAGGGAEWVVLPGYTVKAEYLYVRLGDDSFNVVTQRPFPGTQPSSFRASWSTADFHTVRVGLNYKFDSSAPVVAK